MASKRRNHKKILMEKKREVDKGILSSEEQWNGDMTAPKTEVKEMELKNDREMPVIPKAIEKNFAEGKKEGIKKSLFLQYDNLEFSDKVLFDAAISDYCQKMGVSSDAIESVNLYVKPEEGKAYYVIDHDSEKCGSFEL